MKVEKYFESINREYRHYGRGYIATYCPNCNYDNRILRQLWVKENEEENRIYWGCWRCEEKGNDVDLIMYLENLPYFQAKQKAEQFRTDILLDPEKDYEDLMQYIENSKKPDANRKIKLINPENYIPEGVYPIGNNKRVLKYLRSRGFGRFEIIEWKLHFATYGRYKNRIMIPVIENGIIITWQGRDISGKAEIPYLSVSEQEANVNIKNVILNLDKAESPLIIVEGFMDAMTIGSKNAICIMGKGITDRQKELIRIKDPEEIIIILDGDAVLEADKMKSDLSFISKTSYIFLPFNEDCNSLGNDVIWNMINGNY